MLIKIAMYNDSGNCKREDVNDLISSLVRIGYEVYLNDKHICFKLGNDDFLEKEENDE